LVWAALDGKLFHLTYTQIKIRTGNMFEIILNIASCNFEVFSDNILEFLFVIAVWNKKRINYMMPQPNER